MRVNNTASLSEGGVTSFTRKVIGIRKTETLKIVVYDLTPLPRRLVLVTIKVKDMKGKIVAHSVKNRLPAGERYTFVFNGNASNLEWEKGSDNFQLDVTVVVQSANSEKESHTFGAAFEVANSHSGRVRKKWSDITLKRGSVEESTKSQY
jgi:hypothetical protein